MNKVNNSIDSIPLENEKIKEEILTETKKFFKSKTLWINVLAFIAFIVQNHTGFVISEELQMQALTLVNILLRFVTKEAIVWK